jgi:FMN phosphatase YigB (HAD superfamily)
MILGVIFDFDNTIYDYDYCNNLALQKLFSELSIELNKEKSLIENIYKVLHLCTFKMPR